MTAERPQPKRRADRPERGLRACRVLCAFAPALLCLCPFSAHAQGGPPFRTDDPDTPGNRHWEINFGFIGERNPAGGFYQVPDIDINYGLGDRIQLKYELPLALRETRPQTATPGAPAVNGTVIGGLGESLMGIKWRFYEHHPGDTSIHQGLGTGLLALFGRRGEQTQPAGVSGDAPGAVDKAEATGERLPNFELGTYPQLYLNNSAGQVQRGLVSSGPDFYLPIEISGRVGPLRYNADAGYNFGNRVLAQSWNRGLIVGHEFSDSTEVYIELYDQQDANRITSTGSAKQRETTLGLGGRQAMNRAKTLNLLLMGGRTFQAPSASTSQPSWIAYAGLQVIFGPKDPDAPKNSPPASSILRLMFPH